MKYPLSLYFIKIKSLIIPKSIQIQRLKKIENRAKIFADKKDLPFLVRCKILEENERNPDSFTSIGFGYRYEQMKEGKYFVYIYRQNSMAPEMEIILTIFHEYGHYIDYYVSSETKSPLIDLYDNNKFPKKWYGSFTEDFAELFARYILDLISLDDTTVEMLNAIISEGVAVLSDGQKKKTLDLEAFYSLKNF